MTNSIPRDPHEQQRHGHSRRQRRHGGRGELRRAGSRVHPRHPLHLDANHRRRPRRIPGRSGALPSHRSTCMPLGQPHIDRATTARPRGRVVAGTVRPDPRPAQLDLRPRPRWCRPGAGHRAASGRVLRATTRLSPRHHGAGNRRCADREGRDQRLCADHAGLLDRMDRIPPRRSTGPVPGVVAERDRRGS